MSTTVSIMECTVYIAVLQANKRAPPSVVHRDGMVSMNGSEGPPMKRYGKLSLRPDLPEGRPANNQTCRRRCPK